MTADRQTQGRNQEQKSLGVCALQPASSRKPPGFLWSSSAHTHTHKHIQLQVILDPSETLWGSHWENTELWAPEVESSCVYCSMPQEQGPGLYAMGIQ